MTAYRSGLSDRTARALEQTIEDPQTLAVLVEAAYERLRLIARRERAKVAVGETLSTTALVNEAYLKLSRFEDEQQIDSRQFFGLCVTLMRRIVIDHLKKHREALADDQQLELWAGAQTDRLRILQLDELLNEIHAKNPRMAQIVEYRVFGGYRNQEIAERLQVNEKTVRREWLKAKALLEMSIEESL